MSQNYHAFMIVCCKTFQFLGDEDPVLPAVNHFILKIKTANFIKTLPNQSPECSVITKNWRYKYLIVCYHVNVILTTDPLTTVPMNNHSSFPAVNKSGV